MPQKKVATKKAEIPPCSVAPELAIDGKFDPKWEPIYKVKTKNGKVISAHWLCPHGCGFRSANRKAVAIHAKGKAGMFPARCPVVQIQH